MKQTFQRAKTGEVEVKDVPVPLVLPGFLLVKNRSSVISPGTEKQNMDFARKGIIGKALDRPDLVRKVVAVAQTEGLIEAYQQASARLDTLIPLGYSSAGSITGIGKGVGEFKVGDPVACAGVGHASHAEIISVPRTLCVPIPESVSYEDASFAALGAVALHALRLSELQLGDRVAIVGLGLLGLLGVQIAKAWGCQVLGVDVAASKADLANRLGADRAAVGKEAALDAAQALFDGAGADAVVIFASTASNEPLELAAELARARGRIVVPGLVGLDVPRRAFFDKELDLKVSRAWGPGLYDPEYEEKGRDYPLPFVRWTAGRNMEAFLQLLAEGRVKVQPLITHRFPIEHAPGAYRLIGEGKEPYIGVLLTYPMVDHRPVSGATIWLKGNRQTLDSDGRLPVVSGRPTGVGFIGAGNFAKGTLLPIIRRLKGVSLQGIAAATGAGARHSGDKFGFEYCTTDYHELLNDPGIDAIYITTRHNTHAQFAIEALRAGKHVIVEKPLCINEEQLKEIFAAYNEINEKNRIKHKTQFLMVGFNRRFSPFAVALKKWLGFTDLPLVINIRVNAGLVPPERWEQDPEVGGGRIVGEVCHFVDLIQYLINARPVQVYAQTMKAAGRYMSRDNLAITLKMSDGSVGIITYTASGDKAFPRERVEVFRGGAVGLIEDFKMSRFTYRGRTRRRRNLFSVDRGYRAEMKTFFSVIRNGGSPPAAFDEYVLTTLTTFSIIESMQRGEPVEVQLPSTMVTKGSRVDARGRL